MLSVPKHSQVERHDKCPAGNKNQSWQGRRGGICATRGTFILLQKVGKRAY